MSANRVSVGVNISELYRQQARDWMKAAEVARRKTIDAQSQEQYRTKDEHWCVGYVRGKAGDKQTFKLETMESFIKAGVLTVYGHSKEECVARMHMRLAVYYSFRKACPTWEACLDRAGEATIRVAEWMPG